MVVGAAGERGIVGGQAGVEAMMVAYAVPGSGAQTRVAAPTLFDALVARCHDRNVLIVGCLEGPKSLRPERVVRVSATLHNRLSAIADVTGLDGDRTRLQQWSRRFGIDNTVVGLPTRLAECELSRRFDVILALTGFARMDAPHGLLEGARRHLRPEGQLLLAPGRNAPKRSDIAKSLLQAGFTLDSSEAFVAAKRRPFGASDRNHLLVATPRH